MKTLKDLFLRELSDIHDAERRIVKALPKLAKAATSENLKAAFLAHLKETEGHVTKVERVFRAFDAKPGGEKCEAIMALIGEGEEIATEFKESPAINAALIAAAQKVEHYEMASYGCLHAWAGILGNHEAVSLLKEILEQEKNANEALGELAYSSVNKAALGKPDATDSEGGVETRQVPAEAPEKTSRPARTAGASRRGVSSVSL